METSTKRMSRSDRIAEILRNKLMEWGGSDNFADYSYCGGDSGRHTHKRMLSGMKAPKHEDDCLCGHDIKWNCYLMKTRQPEIGAIVVGSCCIERFIPTGMRLACKECGAAHRNRKDNICNDCREKKHYVLVPYEDKGWAKEHGAKWDPTLRSWYCSYDNVEVLSKYKKQA